MNRRKLLGTFGAGAALAVLPFPSFAETYPGKPIKFIIGFAPGGTTDLVGRLMAKGLTDALGQPVIIENKAGASSNIGADAVAKSPPDGYTFYVNAITNAINASLFAKLPFDFEKDFEPVAFFASVPNLMVVNPAVPAKTVKEFIDWVKANPGKVAYASSGNGTSIHLSGELFKLMTRTEMLHVPYKGSAPALTDLVGGQVQVMFDNMPSSLPLAKSGKLRALAVTSPKRSPSAPDIPTLDEAGVPGYDVGSWFGLMAPKGTPREIITRLNVESNKILNSQEMRERFLELGAVPLPMSPEKYGEYIHSEIKKYAELIRISGAKSEG